jgi:hypothetical protein
MSNPERLARPFRHVDSLRVLVHPMFLDKDPYGVSNYADLQKALADQAVARFAPQAAGEVLLVMPNTASWFTAEQNRKHFTKIKQVDPSRQTWPDLFKRLRTASLDHGNVRLVENFALVSDPNPASILSERLRKFGFYIDTDTEVILGGEWLNVCVETAARKLLACGRINEVKIDRHVVIESPDHIGTQFAPFMRSEPYEMSADQDYFLLKRKSQVYSE